MINKNIFTRELLIAISDWQRGWSEVQERRRLLADELVIQCEKLPKEFKQVNGSCYRKRFINSKELIPILIDDDFFEGIASWTESLDYAKGFKARIRNEEKFVTVFKHRPLPQEVVVNIVALWKDEQFKKAAEEFRIEDETASKPLFHFKDDQSEIILKSTLKGTEIEDIKGVSSSFEVLCDKANIPEEKREELSIRYSKDPNGIPIEFEYFAGSRATKEAIKNTLNNFKEKIESAKANNGNINWSGAATPHIGDLKHKPII
ncbi:hypothetical protein [Lacinutrix sp. MEBiC02595]